MKNYLVSYIIRESPVLTGNSINTTIVSIDPKEFSDPYELLCDIEDQCSLSENVSVISFSELPIT